MTGSSKKKRDQKAINAKISKALKGRIPKGGKFVKGFDPRRKDWKTERQERIENGPWEELPKSNYKDRVLYEQGGNCLCGINEWQGEKLSLELDHIDGNNQNNSRDNLRVLCPNCHSLTPTFRCKKRPEGYHRTPYQERHYVD